MSKQLSEPILDNGVQTTHFFNGRLLAAEDLQTVQQAERQHHRQIAHALGSGIVEGLHITLTSTGGGGKNAAVSLTPGWAISPAGDVLELPDRTDLVLARQADPTAAAAGAFANRDAATAAGAVTGVGVYVLVISPASGTSGSAPMSGVGSNGAITGCGQKYELEGVSFRLVRFPTAGLPSDLLALMTDTAGDAQLSLLRNGLAHVCFGTQQLLTASIDPFASPTGRSEADWWGGRNAFASLTADDVPVALVYWTNTGINFVDMWSVRRRPAATLDTYPWAVLAGERRLRVAEAVWLQFQEHLDWLGTLSTKLSTVQANKYFRYLPPAALVPIAGPGSKLFDAVAFLTGLTTGTIAATDANLVRPLLDEALRHEPVDVSRSDAALQAYFVAENISAFTAGTTLEGVLVCASRTLSYRGVARYSVAKWGESRFLADPQ